jgi:hypothetical protein
VSERSMQKRSGSTTFGLECSRTGLLCGARQVSGKHPGRVDKEPGLPGRRALRTFSNGRKSFTDDVASSVAGMKAHERLRVEVDEPGEDPNDITA